VTDCPRFPLFSPDWTAEEEMKLLTGIRQYGLGNWVDIAEHVSSNGAGGKTAAQVARHYLEDWMGRHGHVLPPVTLRASETGTEVPTESLVRPEERAKYFENAIPPFPGSELLKPGDPAKSREEAVKKEAALVRQLLAAGGDPAAEAGPREEARALGIALPPTPKELAALPGAELGGYMARRGDCDVEFDDDAEQGLADMEFGEKEAQSDRELKLSVLAIYNRKLRERAARKKFAIERGLLDYRALQARDARLGADERELAQRLRAFARFGSREEHERLVESALEARRVRKEIEKLQLYRLMGMETVGEVDEYEREMQRREKRAREGGDAQGAGGKARRAEGASSPPRAPPGASASLGDGADLLSPKEAGLCGNLGLGAAQYLALKEEVVALLAAKGAVDKTTKG
jgi:transcriptional adapter 2-alpha